MDPKEWIKIKACHPIIPMVAQIAIGIQITHVTGVGSIKFGKKQSSSYKCLDNNVIFHVKSKGTFKRHEKKFKICLSLKIF
jgi:hypothetical protein